MYGIKDFVPPVAGKYRITSGEGSRKSGRTNNGAKMSSFHHGTDWAGEKPGSKPDIQNITAGKVVWAGNAGGYGKTVLVQNPDGYTVQYAHLDSIDVKVGDQVPAGGKIGVMGSTGNVTGTHLDMVVSKDGKSLKRDGTVLADVPASIAKRAGGKVPAGSTTPSTSTQSAPTQSIMVGGKPQTQPIGQQAQQAPSNDMFAGMPMSGGDPMNLLNGAVGLAVPDTASENQLYGNIAGMNLDGGLEQIYAEAARAVAGAKDSIESQPMIQSTNPLRGELRTIFDRLEI